MTALAMIFAEDTIAVLGFAIFAVLVYYLIGFAFRKYSRSSHTRETAKRPLPFQSKRDDAVQSRKNFSRNVIPGNGIGGNTFQ